MQFSCFSLYWWRDELSHIFAQVTSLPTRERERERKKLLNVRHVVCSRRRRHLFSTHNQTRTNWKRPHRQKPKPTPKAKTTKILLIRVSFDMQHKCTIVWSDPCTNVPVCRTKTKTTPTANSATITNSTEMKKEKKRRRRRRQRTTATCTAAAAAACSKHREPRTRC